MMIRALIITFCLFMSLPAQAQTGNISEPPVGMILAVEGDGNIIMRASEDGKAYPAKNNDQVYRNDLVQSGPGPAARILVVMIDETRFTLGMNSKFKIDDYAFDDKDDAANMARYTISQGVFIVTTGSMTKKTNPDVKVTTPYGALSLRESSVWGGQLGEQYGVFVDSGEASLESRRGHMFIKAGQGTSIRGINTIPERPHALADEIINAAQAMVTLSNIDQIKTRMETARKNYPAMIELHKGYIHTARTEQLDRKGYVRRQGPGVLRIEQGRQDEKMKARSESDAANAPKDQPSIMDNPIDGMARRAAPTEPAAPVPDESAIDKGPAPAARPEPTAAPKTIDPL